MVRDNEEIKKNIMLKYVPKSKSMVKASIRDVCIIFREMPEVIPREWENISDKKLRLGRVGPNRWAKKRNNTVEVWSEKGYDS